MQKIVVVSTNNNPDYMFYAPYVEYAWNKLGWTLAICITHDVNSRDIKTQNPDTYFIRLPDVEGIREQTIAQGGRLYAANYLPEDCLIMTSDMDLIPLSDYWHPDSEKVTVYGHDLTWYSFFPMGYIAMTGANWKKYMQLTGNTERDFLRDAKETELAYAPDWESWWNFDWDLITKRLRPYKKDLTLINRGQIDIAGGTLAKGRIDRFNWEATQNQPEPFIDMHCENNNVQHPDKLEKFLKVWNKFYGEK